MNTQKMIVRKKGTILIGIEDYLFQKNNLKKKIITEIGIARLV